MDEPRYRLDDLRRFATALGVAAGLRSSRAAALASQLAWYDESGFGRFGLQTLPDWLERIVDGRIDPAAEGVITGERIGTAVLDGRHGLPPLVMARAAALAIEKSRDAGVGLVCVTGIERAGPGAAVVAAMAVGPVMAASLGPGGSLALALPAADGPAVFDSALADEAAAARSDPAVDGLESARAAAAPWAPWLLAMVPDGGYLLVAVAVKAVEPLMTFHERVADMMRNAGTAAGQVLSADREPARRGVREHGMSVTTETSDRLRQWAERLGVAFPPPASSAPTIAYAPGGAR